MSQKELINSLTQDGDPPKTSHKQMTPETYLEGVRLIHRSIAVHREQIKLLQELRRAVDRIYQSPYNKAYRDLSRPAKKG